MFYMFVSILLLVSQFTNAQNPTLLDFWQDRASFKDEQIIRFPNDPYNSEWDFYYHAHDSGMALIQDPLNPTNIYYFMEWWKNGDPNYLEPHVYRSTDGGLNFTHLGKILDVSNSGSGPLSSTYAYWNLNDKNYFHFQLRDPDVMYYQNAYWIVYESAAKTSGGEQLIGPAVVKLANLNTLPITVQHGITMRQHPLMTTYDGDPFTAGLQETSLSTPFWFVQSPSIYVLWAGVHPINSTWKRADTYRGHYSSQPGSPLADCGDPMYCFFTPDESTIDRPYLGIGPSGSWDSKNVNGFSMLKENNYYYIYYCGAICPTVFCTPTSGWGMTIARSSDSQTWERKTINGRPAILDDSPALMGKLLKINEQYMVYYYDVRPPGPTESGVARNYRMTLKWNPGYEPTATPASPLPTATFTRTYTPTNTLTFTFTPTKTNTPIPPTSTKTNTPLLPTSTFTATRTKTPVPNTATSTNTTAPTNTPKPYTLGDANCDSSITPGDALLAFQIYLRLYTPTGNEACDVNRAADQNEDGAITPGDALCIFREYLRNPC